MNIDHKADWILINEPNNDPLSQVVNTPENKYLKQCIVRVGMDQGLLVEASDQQRKLLTRGVLGCNVVAIEGIHNGVRFGGLTHYSPYFIDINVARMEELGRLDNSSGENDEINAVIFVRGRTDYVNDKKIFIPSNEEETVKLFSAVKKAFGEKTNIKVVPYRMDNYQEVKDHGDVWVDISENPEKGERIVGIF